MEKAHNNIVAINKGLNLPVGYRFRPTDEEIVVHYLKKKVFSLPLPASIIPDLDVFHVDPSALPGDVKEKRYFFCNKKKGNDGFNIRNVVMGQKKRACFGTGYWKPIGKDRIVVASDDPNRPVGLRRTMVFVQGRRFSDTKTRWLMHQYQLVSFRPAPSSLHLVCGVGSNERWVVCGVFQKKRRPIKRMKNYKRIEEMTKTMMSFSNGISEVSSQSHGLDDDQEKISAINLTCFR